MSPHFPPLHGSWGHQWVSELTNQCVTQNHLKSPTILCLPGFHLSKGLLRPVSEVPPWKCQYLCSRVLLAQSCGPRRAKAGCSRALTISKFRPERSVRPGRVSEAKLTRRVVGFLQGSLDSSGDILNRREWCDLKWKGNEDPGSGPHLRSWWLMHLRGGEPRSSGYEIWLLFTTAKKALLSVTCKGSATLPCKGSA